MIGTVSALAARLLLPIEIENLQRKISEVAVPFPLDRNLIQALMAGEDHRFLYHRGLDPIGIVRATVRTLGGRLEGASTIEQQLVRTLLGDYRISLRRKAREALIASTLVDHFSKIDILRAYLSVAHFGYQARGFQEAIAKIQPPNSICNFASSYLISHLKFPRTAADDAQADRRRISRAIRISKRIEKLSDWILIPWE